MVGALRGTETCMHISIHRNDLHHGDVARQQSVELVCELGTINGCVMLEMCYHHTGMHTGICSTGSHHFLLLAKQCREGTLQLLLNRIAIGLHLPTVI